MLVSSTHFLTLPPTKPTLTHTGPDVHNPVSWYTLHLCLERPCCLCMMPLQPVSVPSLLHPYNPFLIQESVLALFRLKTLVLSPSALFNLVAGGEQGAQLSLCCLTFQHQGHSRVQIRFSLNLQSELKEFKPRNIQTDYREGTRNQVG